MTVLIGSSAILARSGLLRLLRLFALHAVGLTLFVVLPLATAVWVAWCALLEYRRDRVSMLLYHRLLAKADVDRGTVIDDEMIYVCYDTRFAEQMEYLRSAGFTTMDLDDYFAARAGRMPLPPKPVVITFDDGYESNYRLAFPTLKRLGFKAVVFVAPEPEERTRRLVEGLDGFLTDEQMRELSDHQVSIQSHTMTHCVLRELDDATALRELTESKAHLARVTGKPVDYLAVPRAGSSRRVRRLVRQAGYKAACANAKGSANAYSDPFDLPRIVVERDMSLDEFARALTPFGCLQLRIIGELKRIPVRLGGRKVAVLTRTILFSGPWRSLFKASNLKRLVMLVAFAYLAGGALYVRYILTH